MLNEKEYLNIISKIFRTRDFLQAKRDYYLFMQKLTVEQMELVKDIIKYRYLPSQQMEMQRIESQFTGAFGVGTFHKAKIDFINQLLLENIEPVTITEKGIPSPYTKEELMLIFDEIQRKKWMDGNREHFAAIFSDKPLIDCNGWKPIEYFRESPKKKGEPHTTYLGALIATLSPDKPTKTIGDNYFYFKNKPFNIPKNNRQTDTSIGEVESLFEKAKVKIK